MARSRIHIGTSGWHYKHWVGPFYPAEMRPAKFLDHYVQFFDTVEINNSFYRLPEKTTFADWRASTPSDFLFAVKASRFITHMKKLKDPGAAFGKFFERVKALREKLGPILFQLPGGWGANPNRLREFLDTLPRGLRCAFEFRDPSWFTPEVEDALRQHSAAFCIYEFDRLLSPKAVTADFVYVRLHGPEGRYQGSYRDATLAGWARHFRRWQRQGKDVYCYFDNDQAAYAAKDALRLKKMVGAATGTRTASASPTRSAGSGGAAA